MHKIILHRNAVKFYRKANDTLKERVADAFDVIARNPHLDGHIKKLKGVLKHMHRFRMGDLLIEARILAVADALEDLTSNRSYRNAFPLNEALEKISTNSGSKYDPTVVSACLRLFNEKG